MRFLLCLAVCACLFAGNLLSAQEITQPGQPAAVSLSRPRIEQIENPAAPEHSSVNRLWTYSLIAMMAATSLDATTSWGKTEGNGLLASSNGTFGARGLTIKAGIAAASIVPQLLLRHHENLKRRFAIANFAEAGLFTGVSIHNLGIAKVSR